MSFFEKRRKPSNHARDRTEPRKDTKRVVLNPAESTPKLRRVTIYQITDTEDGKQLKWTVHGEHVVTLKDLVFEGEVTLTYRALPLIAKALGELATEQEARRRQVD